MKQQKSWQMHQQRKKSQQKLLHQVLHPNQIPRNPNQPQPNLKIRIHTLQNHQTQYQIINTSAQLSRDSKKSAKILSK